MTRRFEVLAFMASILISTWASEDKSLGQEWGAAQFEHQVVFASATAVLRPTKDARVTMNHSEAQPNGLRIESGWPGLASGIGPSIMNESKILRPLPPMRVEDIGRTASPFRSQKPLAPYHDFAIYSEWPRLIGGAIDSVTDEWKRPWSLLPQRGAHILRIAFHEPLEVAVNGPRTPPEPRGWAMESDSTGLFGGTNQPVIYAAESFELLPPIPVAEVPWGEEVPAADPRGWDPLYHASASDRPVAIHEQANYAARGSPGLAQHAVRLGWWDVNNDGSPTKVGEYQSLRSSPFWDFDGLSTDGLRTFDFFGTGFDDEGTQVGLQHFGPAFSTRIDYERFLRRLDHDPLSGFTPFDQQPPNPLPPAPRNFRVMKEDLNVGEDYAIRVQELDTSFEGKLSDNLKWRLNVWGMRKKGERQVNAMAHCFTATNATDNNGNPVTGVSCHVLSQRQRIDWLTMQVEPVLAAKVGPATVEYSHTLRTFSQDDQVTTRPYDNFGFMGDLAYAAVPDNQTDIDRLKIGWGLSDHRNAYAHLYNGNTQNQFRDTNRRFHGFDLRLTDRSFQGLSCTAYAKNYVQTGQRPPFLLPLESAGTIRTPINYDRTTVGIRGRWRPFQSEPSIRRGLSFSGGYEFGELERENARFAEQALTVDQSHTTTNSLRARAAMRWSSYLDSYLRYRVAFIRNPLFGLPTRNTATNSSLPTQEHLVDIGATWSPVDVFLISASFGIINGWNLSEVARFEQDDYPITLTAWYAPTPRWSISGGLAFYSSWIDQDITLGSKSNPLTLPWSYGGTNDVINVGTTYARTECLTFSGSFEFVRGRNGFDAPSPFYVDLPPLSDVSVDITRFTAGVDYELSQAIGCYLRFIVFDYEDKSENFNSGTAKMFLGGLHAIY